MSAPSSTLGEAGVPDPLDRHARTALVGGMGADGIRRLAAASVLVVGAGGLGSPVVLYLAAAGIGRLGISDGDAVELSNLQRQVVHSEEAVGSPKTMSAAVRVRALNSRVEVVELPRMTPSLLEDVGPAYDVVVDCTDTFESKYLLADWCAAHGTPLVWATVVGGMCQVSVFAPDGDRAPVTLRDLHPAPPPPDATASSREAGVLGPAVGIAGSLQAAEVIKLVTGVGEPLRGRVLVADVLRGRFDVLSFGAGRG